MAVERAEPTSAGGTVEVHVSMSIGHGGSHVVLKVAGVTVYLKPAAARRVAHALDLHADELEPRPPAPEEGT